MSDAASAALALSFNLQRVANVPQHPSPLTRLMSCARIANRRLPRIIGASAAVGVSEQIFGGNEQVPERRRRHFFSSDCAGNFQLLRLGLHVMGNYEPAAVDFLVDVRDNVVHLLISAVLHFWCPALLPHFPREIAVNVNVLV